MEQNTIEDFWLPGSGKKIFSPKTDFVFKKVFGNPNNKEIVIDLLKNVLDLPEEEYEAINFTDPFLNKQRKNGKYSILDLVITTKSGHKIDLEMQNKRYNYFEKRIDYYQARLSGRQLDGNDDYSSLKKSIVVFILGHEYFSRDIVPEPLTRWRTRNDNGILLNNTFEVKILELPKIPRNHGDTPLYDWADFFRAKTESDLDKLATKSKILKKAVSVLREISADATAQLEYDAWIRDIRMQNCIYDTGKEEGLKEGEAKGEVKAKLEVTKKLVLEAGMTLEEAMTFSGLDESYKPEVEKLLGK